MPSFKIISRKQTTWNRTAPVYRQPGLALSLILVLMVSFWSAPHAWPQAPVQLVAVDAVTEGKVGSRRTVVGTVTPLRQSTIGSAVAGRVIEFPVNEGDRVTKGQPVAQLLTNTLKIQLSALQAELNLREQELLELQNGTRPAELAQAKSRMLLNQATLEYARTKHRRYQNLFQNGKSVSQEEVAEISLTASQAEQSFNIAKLAWELAVEGPRPEKIAQAHARLTQQQQEVLRLEDMLAKHTIRAPFDGYIVSEQTEIGTWVTSGSPIVGIAALDIVEIRAEILEDHVQQLHTGMDVVVDIGAIPGRVFTGKLTAIVPQANRRSRTFPVKVRLENERTANNSVLLKSGMFARTTFAVGSTQKAMLISKDALVLSGTRRLVYVVDLDSSDKTTGKARPVPVDVGVASKGRIQVIGTLKPGELVIVQGNERILPGASVQLITPNNNGPTRGASKPGTKPKTQSSNN